MTINQKLVLLVSIGILVIALIGHLVFDMPIWIAVLGAIAGVFANGILLMFGPK